SSLSLASPSPRPLPSFPTRRSSDLQARALMEDQQMLEHPFFSKIGAFSVNLSNTQSAIRSLRYAVKSFERPNASLFIYPEGTITPAGTTLQFEKGLAWLAQEFSEAEIVPIAIY